MHSANLILTAYTAKVITAGTAIRESLGILKEIEGTTVSGIVVSLDRQEKVSADVNLSAIQLVQQETGVTVLSIVVYTIYNILYYTLYCIIY